MCNWTGTAREVSLSAVQELVCAMTAKDAENGKGMHAFDFWEGSYMKLNMCEAGSLTFTLPAPCLPSHGARLYALRPVSSFFYLLDK